ncbi:hypothetical protein PR048_019542 [Dryococelus australis]|uniref:HTH CENPB-type domain-containing protein n=1 Tax=Dryococelus australis TaxID=614101 RepID=A0ABQ9H3S0_9NEOP|nr:hypothetical protein PR048_019542 [Dryococelus australis]
MLRNVRIVREKTTMLKKAAKYFAAPNTTLRQHAHEVLLSPEDVMKNLGRKPTLSEKISNELVDCLLVMEVKFYGLTRMDVRKMAYQLAARNGIRNWFKGECAGRAWFDHFFRRHRDRLAIRKQPTRRL